MLMYGWVGVALIAILSVLWYLGIFDIGQKVAIPSGFSRIKPADPSIVMNTEGDFSAIFINGALSSVSITSMSIINDAEEVPKKCIIVTEFPIYGRPNAKFDIYAWNCTSQEHNIGEFYFLNVTLNHDEVVTGLSLSRTERGVIRGYYEGVVIIPGPSIEGFPVGEVDI